MNYNIFMPINKLPLLPNKVEELALDFCKIINCQLRNLRALLLSALLARALSAKPLQ